MLWITCILIGLFLGQQVRLSASPELSEFMKSVWVLANEKAPAIKATTVAATKRIKSAAIKTKASSKAAPIQIFEITEGGEQAL